MGWAVVLLFIISTKQFHPKAVLKQCIVAHQSFQTQETEAGLPQFIASAGYTPCLKITKTKSSLQHRRWSICPQRCINQAWQCTPVNPALGKECQQDQEFKAILNPTVSLRPTWVTGNCVQQQNELQQTPASVLEIKPRASSLGVIIQSYEDTFLSVVYYLSICSQPK